MGRMSEPSLGWNTSFSPHMPVIASVREVALTRQTVPVGALLIHSSKMNSYVMMVAP